MDKIVLLKTGWCDTYDGDEVQGNFAFLRENGGVSGHEKFNFRATLGKGYFGYCPPISAGAVPRPEEPSGWTVVWVSRLHDDCRAAGEHRRGAGTMATLYGDECIGKTEASDSECQKLW